MNNPETLRQAITAGQWYVDAAHAWEHGKLTIRLAKMISGYVSAYPSGYFEYKFAWANEAFGLEKESFFVAKGLNMIDPTVIKETGS
ncbi:hypothetical protein [Paenibacillus sp. MMS18-CY102]|uniref:hypothetical protein n=1 Tax=Paenibacillus sp. MMS18-CY102 TaxID=2682849 RepID=UPI00136629CC|nr:hypothetical protein [Paenibacillus sp. MMS18-CY102]MWC27113.1 hypothetical protein [Paenibacillus sp. MMS18-CY102]